MAEKQFSLGEVLSVATRCKLSETDPRELMEHITGHTHLFDIGLMDGDVWEDAQIALARQLPWTSKVSFTPVPESKTREQSQAIADQFVAATAVTYGDTLSLKAVEDMPNKSLLARLSLRQ